LCHGLGLLQKSQVAMSSKVGLRAMKKKAAAGRKKEAAAVAQSAYGAEKAGVPFLGGGCASRSCAARY
jgi:hypothetical protein